MLGCSLTDAQPKRPDRMRDVLHQLLAQIFKDHVAVMTQVIAHASRNADFTAPDQPLEPSGDIHAVAENVVILDHDVADIDADPKAHPPSFRLAFICPLKRRLDLDRAPDRVKDAGEFGEYTVTGSVRDPASMLRDKVIDNGAAGRQCRHRRFFVAMHQAAVTLDIRGEDGH